MSLFLAMVAPSFGPKLLRICFADASYRVHLHGIWVVGGGSILAIGLVLGEEGSLGPSSLVPSSKEGPLGSEGVKLRELGLFVSC